MNWPAPTQQLIDVLPKVDALNSWVRSQSFRRAQSGLGGRLDFVIYHLKAEAIKAAKTAGIAYLRLVGLDVKCRDCDGTGKYVDWEGRTFPHCRACSSTGTAHLQFIESTLVDTYIWHSPANWRLNFADGWSKWVEESAGDWHPKSAGRDLELDSALLFLNEVEQAFPARPYARHVRGYYEDDLGGEVNDFATYRIHLGHSDRERCIVCGSTEGMYGGLGCNGPGRTNFTAHVCKECYGSNRDGCKIFRICEGYFPETLLTPAVKAWIERHP